MGLDATIKTKDKEIVYLRNKWYLHEFISDIFPELESGYLKCELTKSVLSRLIKDMESFIKKIEEELNDERIMFPCHTEDDLDEAKEIYKNLCTMYTNSEHEKYYYEGSY